jgi:hypothetical protein
MSDESYKVTLNLPEELKFTDEEISALRERFKAHIVETLEKKADDRPVVDDITRVIPPHMEDKQD